MNGILVVDKPAGLSSANTVERVKFALGVRRAGHGGTLDPIATGVLAVCLDGATKLAPYLLADDKAYEAEGFLGVETDTLDRTGAVTARHDVAVTREAILAAIARRLGEQDQVPPMYSAIKQDGVRLYKRARAGEEVERAPRRIRIDQFELIAFEPPMFRVAIACSKGTYVRSLVADLGTDVGAGAHMTGLRRTRSGKFTLAHAVPLDRVSDVDLASVVIPMSQAVDLPIITVGGDQITSIHAGVQLPVDRLGVEGQTRFQFVDARGLLLAIAHATDGKVIYERVFPDSFEPSP